MSGACEVDAMAPQQCPYQVGQPVELISPNGGRTDARVLAIHRPAAGGFEIVVRTIDQVDAPGHNVNLFTTSGWSSWLVSPNAVGGTR